MKIRMGKGYSMLMRSRYAQKVKVSKKIYKRNPKHRKSHEDN